MDLLSIDHKLKNNVYNYVQEFENDFKHFIHNYFVLHLQYLQYFDDDYKLVNKIHKRFNRSICELKLCIDCYNYWNTYELMTSAILTNAFSPNRVVMAFGPRKWLRFEIWVRLMKSAIQCISMRKQFQRDFILIDKLKSIEYQILDKSEKMKSALSPSRKTFK